MRLIYDNNKLLFRLELWEIQFLSVEMQDGW